MNKFLITPGELNGVGLEVSLKALLELKSDTDAFIIYAEETQLYSHLETLNLKLEFSFIKSPSEVSMPGVFIIKSTDSPFSWFEDSINYCKRNHLNSAIVTGPLRKESFLEQKALGHTDYLKKKFPAHQLFMTFIGHTFNTLLLTDHVPLDAVPSLITKKLLADALTHVKNYSDFFTLDGPIYLLGLNPHAGENGLIGEEELSVHRQALKGYPNIIGPVSPDGFFSLDDYQRAGFFIANYHDQGLIPFKMVNGFNSSQTTLGLPFVRTSVCHGTAESLFLQNKANPLSMINSINLAKKLLNQRRTKNEI